MVNENYEPSDTEEKVLSVLAEEWRANPMLIREQTDLGKGSINTALTRLTSAGWVRKVTRGLYEFVDDPRTESEPQMPESKTTDDQAVMADRKNTAEARASELQPDDKEKEMLAALEKLDVPGRPAEVEKARREAIKYAWRRLRHKGSMRPRDLANDTLGEFWNVPELNYSTASGRYAGYQLMDNCLRDALSELPGVHKGGSEWYFQEESDAVEGDVYDPTEEF